MAFKPKFHIQFCKAVASIILYVLLSTELKPRGDYLEHVFYLDHVIFTNMSHVYYMDKKIFILSHEYYLKCAFFTNQSRVYYLAQ